jgi:hypothetical protein
LLRVDIPPVNLTRQVQAGGDALPARGEVVIAPDGPGRVVRFDLHALAREISNRVVRDGHHAVGTGADDEDFWLGLDDLLQVLGDQAVPLHSPPVRDDAVRQDYHIRAVLAAVHRYAAELVRFYRRRHVNILADGPPGVEFFVAPAPGLYYLKVG